MGEMWVREKIIHGLFFWGGGTVDGWCGTADWEDFYKVGKERHGKRERGIKNGSLGYLWTFFSPYVERPVTFFFFLEERRFLLPRSFFFLPLICMQKKVGGTASLGRGEGKK